METFGGTDSGVQGAIKTLDSHFAKADAILQVFWFNRVSKFC